MDTSYLTTQVSSIIGSLHGLFDEIGVPTHERESRESEVHSNRSSALFTTGMILTAVDSIVVHGVVGDTQ